MGSANSAFNVDYVYTAQSGGQATSYKTSLSCRQYRRPSYRTIPSIRRVRRSTRGKLWLGDTVKIIIHNFILDNVNQNERHRFPGTDEWAEACLAEIQRDEPRATLEDVHRWVSNHSWIKRRHCEFRVQRRCNRQPEPVMDPNKPFKVQHLYKAGRKGRAYTVDLELFQFHRLPNNFPHGHPPTENYKTTESMCYKIRPKPKTANMKRPVFGDTLKLIVHNFTLENVNQGEPHGIPGEECWVRAVTARLREYDPRVTEDIMLYWLHKHCWIILRHNDWTAQNDGER